MRFKQGQPRHQTSLLPPSIEEYVVPDSPVRVIDAFVGSLNMAELGFEKATTKQTGCRPYNPADLLKLFLYGYLNQITSTRKLEKECHRNLEMIWLMGQLAPDFKTIADFRKNNSSAIKKASAQLVMLCRRLKLISGDFVAIDGSKFKAAASKDQTFTKDRLQKYLTKLEKRIDSYLQKLAESEHDNHAPLIDRSAVEKALKTLQQEQQQKAEVLSELVRTDKQQHCFTEPEAQLMRSGRSGVVTGYNAQNAVDGECQIIIAHELTQAHSDNQQLTPMAEASKTALQEKPNVLAADAGYSNGQQLTELQAKGFTTAVPPNRATNNKGGFQKDDFEYLDEEDAYRCPAGELLHYATYNSQKRLHQYKRSGCDQCELQNQCTKADTRWISRHYDEPAFKQAKLNATPGRMKRRMSTVEPPFGTLKRMMGDGRFKCWGLTAAAGEYSLAVMSYNLMRAINVVSVKAMLEKLA